MLHHIQQCSFATLALLLVIFNGTKFIMQECQWKYGRMCHRLLPRVTHSAETCDQVSVCSGVFSFVLGKRKEKKKKRTQLEVPERLFLGVPLQTAKLSQEFSSRKIPCTNPNINDLSRTAPNGLGCSHPLCGCPGAGIRCVSVHDSVGFPNTNMTFPSDSLAGAQRSRWKYVFDTLWKEKHREASWAGVFSPILGMLKQQQKKAFHRGAEPTETSSRYDKHARCVKVWSHMETLERYLTVDTIHSVTRLSRC